MALQPRGSFFDTNHEKCIISNILSKKSPKGISNIGWQKRMFRLYKNRITYSDIESDETLGEIPLISITQIQKYPENNKTKFNLILGSIRIFELKSSTKKISSSWINILTKLIPNESINDKTNYLQKQKKKFWKKNNKKNSTKEEPRNIQSFTSKFHSLSVSKSLKHKYKLVETKDEDDDGMLRIEDGFEKAGNSLIENNENCEKIFKQLLLVLKEFRDYLIEFDIKEAKDTIYEINIFEGGNEFLYYLGFNEDKDNKTWYCNVRLLPKNILNYTKKAISICEKCCLLECVMVETRKLKNTEEKGALFCRLSQAESFALCE